MKELRISLFKIIISCIIIVIIAIIVKNKKEKEYKEQLRNLKLQKYYEEKEKKNPYIDKIIQSNKYPYKLNSNIFTDTEKFFYKVLKDITNKMDLIIMAKVRLADIIYTKNNNYKYFNKIKAKHIDFVIIDKDGNIKLLIELDDKSHENKIRQKRDDFINDIFKQLDIDLLRIPAKYSYNVKELEKQIKESLKLS